MARRKRGYSAEEDEPTVDISSLIDVCFLLLIYFIVTQTIAVPESDLVLALPSESNPTNEKPPVDPAFFVVLEDGTINRVTDGSVYELQGKAVGKLAHRKPTDMVELDKQVKMYKDVAKENAIIKVKADPEVKAQYVVDLLNVLAKHGITKITFVKNAP